MTTKHGPLEAFRRILFRARKTGTDPEGLLIHELVRYLEHKPGVFSEVAGNGAISLQAIKHLDWQPGHGSNDAQQLDGLIEEAEQTGLGMLDLLQAETKAQRLELREALRLAFQFGKRVRWLAEQVETRPERRLHGLTTHCERRAVEREMAERFLVAVHN